MKSIACRIVCPCGGFVHVIMEDGAYYILTERHTIIFQGRCNKCFESVKVEMPILELMLHCPSNDKHVN